MLAKSRRFKRTDFPRQPQTTQVIISDYNAKRLAAMLFSRIINTATEQQNVTVYQPR